MKIQDGLISAKCKVVKIEPSKIRKVVLTTMECSGLKVTMDLAKELLIFSEGDEIEFLLSRDRPEFEEGKDLVIWGYVMTKKRKPIDKGKEGGFLNKLLVSLWGYLLVLESTKEILDSFSVMDKVYLKISKK